MRGLTTSRRLSAVVGASCALVLGMLVSFMTAPVRTQSVGASRPGPSPFLQVGRCYRFTFTIVGTPNWKVLEVVEGGWVRAESDAGPASAEREPAWINTSQIVTVRDARCSA